VLVLDAGTGIRSLGAKLMGSVRRVDVLLTHLHMDHIQGLGFFAPLYDPNVEVHIWGPISTTLSLSSRLSRYLSPPLFPVRLRDLPCKLSIHEVGGTDFEVGDFKIRSSFVIHPGPTVGYRIVDRSSGGATLAYLPDHEPALGLAAFPLRPEWTSGYELIASVDLLIHDAQYTGNEYAARIGWGHSSFGQVLSLASLCEVRQVVPFHHDPSHNDADLDAMIRAAIESAAPGLPVLAGTEGASFELRR
jgi:phosphoribosyl 1,2-cyclic phosphodiesterase